jgi:hypothetical protein
MRSLLSKGVYQQECPLLEYLARPTRDRTPSSFRRLLRLYAVRCTARTQQFVPQLR